MQKEPFLKKDEIYTNVQRMFPLFNERLPEIQRDLDTVLTKYGYKVTDRYHENNGHEICTYYKLDKE